MSLLSVLVALVVAGCGGSAVEDGAIRVSPDSDYSGLLTITDVTRQPYKGELLGLDPEDVEGKGDYLVVSYVLDSPQRDETLYFSQLAVGWGDKVVECEHVGEVAVEVDRGESAEFELTYELSDVETLSGVRSPDDVRILFSEELDDLDWSIPLLGGPGELDEAAEQAEVDVPLSDLWQGSFD